MQAAGKETDHDATLLSTHHGCCTRGYHVGCPLFSKAQQSPRELFERARIVEEANQDLMQAIRLYEQAAGQAKGDRALAAQALLRAAESYQKLGKAQAGERL